MRRLGLILLCMAMLFGTAHAEEYEAHEESLLYWSKLTYQGEAIDVTVPPPHYKPENDHRKVKETFESWYRSYFDVNRDVCDTLVWGGIKFNFLEEPPNFSSWLYTWDTISAWPLYFNEMYFLGAKPVQVDENGYSPFWAGLRFCGEPVDPSTPPPNYDPEMDYWREVRDLVGYAWYWYYWVIDSIREYENDDVITWTWNGTEFEPFHSPPTYPSDHNDAARIDPWYHNHQVRGYLDLWEEYFNELYYESLAE